jgi:hypothetical protein
MKLNIHEFLTHLEFLNDEATEQRIQIENQKRATKR